MSKAAATLLLLLSVVGMSAAPVDDKMIRVGHDKIPNEYLVILEDSVLPEKVAEVVTQLATAHGARVEATWLQAVKGFFAVMSESNAEALSRHPFVKYVEKMRHGIARPHTRHS